MPKFNQPGKAQLKLLTYMIVAGGIFGNISTAFADQEMFTPEKIKAALSTGVLSGKTNERVYDPGTSHKASQLDWKYDNAPVLKGSIEWDLLPSISLRAAGWTTIQSHSAYMRDTDWQDLNSSDWTDQSKHPDTRLNYANQYDLSLQKWIMKSDTYRLGLSFGYQESRFSFNSPGGSFNYLDQQTGERVKGQFLKESVITYKQKSSIPYIGMVGSYRINKFEFNGGFKYSKWVKSSDRDNHQDRNIIFRSKIQDQQFYAVTASAGYYLASNTKLYVESELSHTANKRGKLSAENGDNGTTESSPDSGAIENRNLVTTVGVNYSF